MPQGVAGFFNLVKEHDADLHGFGVMLVKSLLTQPGKAFSMTDIARG